MKKTLYLKKLESLIKALEELGYREVSEGWRRGEFHFRVVKHMKDRFIIEIHRDLKGLRALHRASNEGVKEEIDRIVDKYYEVRRGELKE